MKFPRCLLILLAPPGIADAVQIASEPFQTGLEPASGQYLVGVTNLIGQNPSTIGFTGSWLEAYGGAQSPDVRALGLSYPALVTTGGMVSYSSGGNGRCGRRLATPYGDASTGTIYLAFLLQLESTGPGYRAIELHQGGFDDGGNRKLQIAVGESSGGRILDTDLGLRVNQDDTTGMSLGALDTEVNLIIVRIDFSTDPLGDTISVFRNPTDLAIEENNSPTAVVAGIDFRFDRVSLARFNDSTGFGFDELRIGTDFNSVTGTVNPDADGDGMDDGWEFINMVDDPDDDPDSDGLTNLEEFEAGTNPNAPDSDADGIADMAELDGSGNTFDGLATDPINPDSDGDGIDDGAEVSDTDGYVTNPNAADTDGDDEDDPIEIAEGTNPLDPESNSAALGRFIIDGKRDSLYGAALAVQTIETGFGDNMNELNAAYAAIRGDSLYLLLTGNLETNFNKLEILIDSVEGGSNTFVSAGNDNSANMNGLIFDTPLMPDFHLIARRGSGKLDLDFADLGMMRYASYIDVFAGSDAGRATTGTPTDSTFATDPSPIGIAYDGSNEAGVGGTAGAAADQVAASAVKTGIELCIKLDELGAAARDLRICAFINNSEHSFASNQFLGGLPDGTGNLAEPMTIDLNNLPGEQFFSVPFPMEPTRIGEVQYDDDSGELSFTFNSNPNFNYLIESTTDLTQGWDEVDDSYPAEAGATTTFTTTEPMPTPQKKFYRVTPMPK